MRQEANVRDHVCTHIAEQKHHEIQYVFGCERHAAAREETGAKAHYRVEQTGANDDARRRAKTAASANRQAAVWRLFGGGKLNALEGG